MSVAHPGHLHPLAQHTSQSTHHALTRTPSPPPPFVSRCALCLKVVFHDYIPKGTRSILVAPPHGVFPFGNIITMLGFPSVMGYSFNGIAASAALRTPVFRQVGGPYSHNPPNSGLGHGPSPKPDRSLTYS
jgi:hypothetical protein